MPWNECVISYPTDFRLDVERINLHKKDRANIDPI
jgi:hypothetical protein